MGEKKGQLTIFVIVMIVIVVGIIIFFSVGLQKEKKDLDREKERGDYESEEVNRFYSYMSECMKDITKRVSSQIGNDERMIEDYLSVHSKKCFEASNFPGVNIMVEPPFSVELTNNGERYFVEVFLNTQLTSDNYSSFIEKFSFYIEKGDAVRKPIVKEDEEGNRVEEFPEVSFVDAEEEISFVYKNLVDSKNIIEEIIIEYEYIPKDINPFEDFMDSLVIEERNFLISNEELKDYLKKRELHEIVVNHSYDEIVSLSLENTSYEEVRRALLEFDHVKNVSLNVEYRLLDYNEVYIMDSEGVTTNDRFYDYQWYLENKGQFFGKRGADINIHEAWSETMGEEDIIISVIDQGVFKNEDYSDNIIYEKSYNFVNNNKNVNAKNNYEYHATHVIGIISSEVNNEFGIAGICPGCSIINMKVADSDGWIESDELMKAVMQSVSNGAKIVSMSVGGETHSAYEESIFSRLAQKGVIFVAAAGNEGTSTKTYPAAYKDVISVGASDSLDRKADFSNYGNWVDVYAPGKKILSSCGVNNYCFDSGTSMATPVVSAVVGLLLSIKSDLSLEEIRDTLKETGERIEYDKFRVDAGKAVQSILEKEEEVELENTTIETSIVESVLDKILRKRSEILANRKNRYKDKEVKDVFSNLEFNEIVSYCEENVLGCERYCSQENRDVVMCNLISLKD